VDKVEDKMTDLLPLVASAQVGDCAKKEVLQSLGVSNFDICFVCIGSDFESNLLITSRLKDMGAKYVVSKSSRDVYSRFLLRNGADEVVYPERVMAEKLGKRFSANHVFDFIDLTKDFSIAEIPPLPSWIGKTLGEVDLRKKYHVSVLATKNDNEVMPMPPVSYVFKEDEHLMMLGNKEALDHILKKL